MDFILKSIGVLLLSVLFVALIAFLLTFRRIIKSVRQTMRQFNNATTASATNGSQRAGKAGEVIIDSRTSERMNQKIFEENEGEYVDFTEEKYSEQHRISLTFCPTTKGEENGMQCRSKANHVPISLEKGGE